MAVVVQRQICGRLNRFGSPVSTQRGFQTLSSQLRFPQPSYDNRNAAKKQQLQAAFVVRRLFSTAKLTTDRIRNIAIIAHVDHGKTTLVDGLLTQSNTGITEKLERVMDSNPLEKERGITILAKCTSVHYEYGKSKAKVGKYLINIVDTPGHADFGGEVERIMTMVDGVALVVDATSGPMTQTKFVLKKALQAKLRPLVVINKVDRPSNRIGQVENEIFDLFAELGADDDQMDFPIIYASARDGWATLDPADCKQKGTKTLSTLLDMVVEHVPAPVVIPDGLFRMLVTNIHSNAFFGKCLLGRIVSGTVKPGDALHAVDQKGNKIEDIKVLKLLSTLGLDQTPIESALAGQIVSIAGFKKAGVNATLCHPTVFTPLPTVEIDPPTVAMTFMPNTSPLMGKEGNGAPAALIREWLQKEAETNLSIQVKISKSKDATEEVAAVVYGRGELQLGILIETMRRAGFELAVAPPQVVFKKGKGEGEILEPCEEVHIEVDAIDSGTIIDRLSERRGQMQDMITDSKTDRTSLVFKVPTRGLLGYRTEFVNTTRGTGVINTVFDSYIPYAGEIEKMQDKRGAIIATNDGMVTNYALDGLDSRGVYFVKAGVQVYVGMVVGEHSKEKDLEANIAKAKELTNVRSVGKEEKQKITPPVIKTLEQYIAEVRDDELIEVTPQNIRLRKRLLDPNERKKFNRGGKKLLLLGDEETEN